MARSWTPEQAASLAPDAASLKAGQGLASPRKWSLLGQDGRYVWGLAQGSGQEPYQARIDLDEPAFKCSCPSRKFPCKHGLGLLLIFASQPSAIATGARPEWVEEWVAKRSERVAKAEAKAQQPEAAPDPQAQAKRREKRAANLARGVEYLEGWLRDLARQGIAAVQGAGYKFWDEPARRLIDAQAPGLARRLRLLGALAGGAHAEEQLLAGMGRLHLVLSAWRRREELSPEWQAEIDGQVGWTADQEELREKTGLRAVWLAAAQTSSEENGVVTRATYLFSQDGKFAQVLEFSHSSQAAAASLALGRSFEGELVYFPGVQPERALLKTPPVDTPRLPLPFLGTCADLLGTYAARLASNPWRDEMTALVRLVPGTDGTSWWLGDASGEAIPITNDFRSGWELLACSGGRPLGLCGVWNGFAFRPLSVVEESGAIALGG